MTVFLTHIERKKKEQDMKYDDLEAYKEYLYNQVSNANTARKYYSAVVKLFRDVDIRKDIKQLDVCFYQEKIPLLFKTRNEVSAVKNGLRYFEEYRKVQNGTAGGAGPGTNMRSSAGRKQYSRTMIFIIRSIRKKETAP